MRAARPLPRPPETLLPPDAPPLGRRWLCKGQSGPRPARPRRLQSPGGARACALGAKCRPFAQAPRATGPALAARLSHSCAECGSHAMNTPVSAFTPVTFTILGLFHRPRRAPPASRSPSRSGRASAAAGPRALRPLARAARFAPGDPAICRLLQRDTDCSPSRLLAGDNLCLWSESVCRSGTYIGQAASFEGCFSLEFPCNMR